MDAPAVRCDGDPVRHAARAPLPQRRDALRGRGENRRARIGRLPAECVRDRGESEGNRRRAADRRDSRRGTLGVDLFGEGTEFGPLRPCVEDQLGAGAIVSALAGSWSAEAALAAASYAATDVPAALHSCTSGRELAATGHGNDVVLAAQHDVSDSVARLSHGILEGR
nr:2-phosphosulfolactate phosphatase [Amycolatopsis niigatensis]